MHTTVSDGHASIREVLDYVAERRHLDVIAITDHDRLEASLWAYSQQSHYPFEVVPGVEVTSAEGHVLALWVTQPIPKGMSLAETSAAIHEQGGLAVLAHPLEPTISIRWFWRYLTQPSVLLSSGIDALEIFNAGAFTPGSNWLAQRIYHNIDLPRVGSSDSHSLATIATGITRFRGRTACDLRESILCGQTAAEGKSWPITAYLSILRILIQKRLTGSLAANPPSPHLTQP
jgi:hypothetical protein